MGTKANPGKYDCYSKAAPDEPMFVLLARDRHAPLLTRLWALLRHREGEDEEVVSEALQCARQMEEYAPHRHDHTDIDRDGVFEKLLFTATESMAEHPAGFDDVCECAGCRSYD